VLVSVVVLASCSAGDGEEATSTVEADVLAVEADVSALEVEVSMDPSNVLRADLSFDATDGAEATIEVVDAEGEGFRLTVPTSDAAETVVPLLQLTADTIYTVEVTAGERTGSAQFETEPLPEDLPPIDVTSAPATGAAGLTLFDVIPLPVGEGNGEATNDGYLMAVDGQGEVVWYYRQTHSIQDVRQTADGDLIFIHHETGVRRLDVMDGSLTEWSGTTGLDLAPEDAHGRSYAGADAIRVETDQMHHEVLELPNGNLMTLSRELEEIEGYPEALCDDDEFNGSYQVVTDTVVEFSPNDGAVVNEWSLFDLVDPLSDLERIRPAEFCSQYLGDVYPDLGARDWTHANAVVLDEARNAILVSARHLDKILAIRYQDDENGAAGELMWSLGEGGDFTLTDGEWFLHPHAPEVLEDGTIMVYDNGNERPGTSLDDPDSLPYSRAVQYRIDEDEMTAEQVWEHRADAPGEAVYAPFVGDADVLDDGAVLITHGGLLDPPAHSPQAEGVVVWGRVIEVDYETGDVVFDFRIKDADRAASWIIYRAERISTMYPQGHDFEEIGG
jgi:hypothetical protein